MTSKPLDSRRSLGAVGGAVAVTAVTVVVAAAVMLVARAWLADVMTAGGAGVEQRALAGSDRVAAPVERRPVRVVVLDGLTRADAHGPALDALCARGMDLVIDVGFPTKSLPVQAVLWTGLTAQQSGLAMRNEQPAPLRDTVPARIAGARAVVDAWPAIAGAFGFAVEHARAADFPDAAAVAVECRAQDTGDPEPGAPDPERGASGHPERGAKRRVEGRVEGPDACPALVLVHALAIDEAGHRGGRDATYRARVAEADALLADLVARAPDAAWIVLSDHGHVAGGGHGDVEDEVRLVRGCVSPRPPGAPPHGAVHLVDVSRHLHDTLGLAPPPRAVGRPLAIAAAAPDPDATLPRAGLVAWLAALAVWLSSVALAWRFGRPRVAAVAPVAASGLYVLLHGLPSLSTRSPLTALVLGGVIAVALLAAPGRRHPARVIALAVPAAGLVLGGAIVVGLHWALVGGPPPRLPHVTAAWQLAVNLSTAPLLVSVGLAAWLLSDTRTTRGDVRHSGRPGTGR